MSPGPRWLDSSVVRALHRYRRRYGLKSRLGLHFFQALISQLPAEVVSVYNWDDLNHDFILLLPVLFIRNRIFNTIQINNQLYILLTVPEAPQNVNVFSPCSTCLTVTWDPVYTSPTDALTAYHVVYKDASGKAYTKKIGSRKSVAQLTSLGKFSSYTVTVTAMTDEGLGKTSTVVTVTTMEDGEFLFFMMTRLFSVGSYFHENNLIKYGTLIRSPRTKSHVSNIKYFAPSSQSRSRLATGQEHWNSQYLDRMESSP